MTASYAIPVRRASVLPAASFRFGLTTDTLAVQLTVPAVGPVEDFHLQVGVPCRAHKAKRGLNRINQYQPRTETNLLHQLRPHILIRKKQWGPV